MKMAEMRPEHIPGVAALLDSTFEHPWSEDTVRAELRRSDAYCLTALDDGRIIGYLAFEKILDEGSIELIAVDKAHRRQGIARQMLRCVLGCFDDLTVVHLEVRAGNTAAVALYRAEGFEQVGVRARYYQPSGEDALIMQKNMLDIYEEEDHENTCDRKQL